MKLYEVTFDGGPMGGISFIYADSVNAAAYLFFKAAVKKAVPSYHLEDIQVREIPQKIGVIHFNDGDY